MSDCLVVGHFTYSHDAQNAIVKLRSSQPDDAVEYFAPFPDHHLEDAQYKGRKRSPVRRCTLVGGLTGCLGAFLFTCWMSIDYPLRVSAKPLVSIPAFVVIAFECTILLGAICTLLGMLFFSKIPNLRFVPGYAPGFSEGTFGVAVRSTADKTDSLKQELLASGAEHVEVQYVR